MRGSSSCCSTSRTHAAGSSASGRSRSPRTCDELEQLRAAGVRVGVAPHSVRACPREWLEELGAYAAREGLPLHVHADEQPREIEECVAEHGVRPIELLARTRLSRRAHDGRARDARERRRARPARRRGRARLRLPDDGGEPRRRLPAGRARAARAGSRSASARTRTSASTRSRSCASSKGSRDARAGVGTSSRSTSCCASAASEGARSLGLDSWPDVEVDVAHPSLEGVEGDDVVAALVFGASADVFG